MRTCVPEGSIFAMIHDRQNRGRFLEDQVKRLRCVTPSQHTVYDSVKSRFQLVSTCRLNVLHGHLAMDSHCGGLLPEVSLSAIPRR